MILPWKFTFCHHFRLTLILGQSLSASVLNQHRGQPVHPTDSPEGSQQLPGRQQGKMQCLGTYWTHCSQPHTHQEAQVVLQEILRKEVVLLQPLPMTYTFVKGCLLLLSSWSQEPSWGCLSLSHLQGAALQGKECQGLPSTRSARKQSSGAGVWRDLGTRKVRLQDFNPCSSESSLQNIF